MKKNTYKVILFTMIIFFIEMAILKYFDQYNYLSWLFGYIHAFIYTMYVEKLEK